MAILIALRSGFAKYFSPSMVKESILKEQYKFNPQEFNRPVLTRVVHLLARFPRSSNPKDPSIQKKEKKARPALLKKAKLLSQKLLEAIRKEKIKTWQEFESFGSRQMKQLNRPDERLQTWFNGLRSFLKVQKTKATPAFWKQVKRRKHALLPLTFCAYCPQIVRLLDQFINRNENIHKTIQTGEIKRLLTQLNYKANSKVEFVRYERLPGFPRKAQAPFPAMVDPFAKATYELKDGTYSQAPVKTSFGYHIIFRVETAKAHHVPYKIARKRILEAVYRGLKRKKFIAWTKLKFHEHKIDVNLAKLKRMSKLKR